MYYHMRGRSGEQEVQNLAGSLLVAHPALLDPNFRRTIVFLPENHQDDGSYGLILNRPTEKRVGDVLDDAELGSLAKVRLFVGGPVAMNELMFSAIDWLPSVNGVRFRHHLPIDEAREIASHEPAILRAFVGYSGWSKGQLENELTQKAWIVKPPFPDAVNPEYVLDIWFDIMKQMGPWFQLQASAPDDPSLN